MRRENGGGQSEGYLRAGDRVHRSRFDAQRVRGRTEVPHFVGGLVPLMASPLGTLPTAFDSMPEPSSILLSALGSMPEPSSILLSALGSMPEPASILLNALGSMPQPTSILLI